MEGRTEYWEWTSSGEAPNHHYLVPAVIKSLEPFPDSWIAPLDALRITPAMDAGAATVE